MAEKKPTISSMFWAASDTIGVAVLSMIAMLVMARFISPDQFALGSLALGVVLLANLYVEGLLHDALIQREETGEPHIRAAFWAVLLVGTGALAVTVAVALLCQHTRFAEYTRLLAVAGLILPLNGVYGVLNAKFRRSFDYKAVAVPSVLGKVFGAATGVVLAWRGYGALSIVLQFLISVLFQVSFLLVKAGGPPRPTLKFGILRDYWAYALPEASMNFLNGIRLQAFSALIVAFAGLTVAGYVNLAVRLTLTPQLMLHAALSNIGLPMLSRKQGDLTDLRVAFEQFNSIIAAIIMPIFVGIAVCAPLIISGFVGDHWTPSVVPAQILALGAVIYLTRLPTSLTLKARGIVRYSLYNSIVHLMVTIGGILIFRPSTTLGLTLWWVAPVVFAVPVTWFVVVRNTGIRPAHQLRRQIGPMAGCVAMAYATLGIQFLFARQPPVLVLAASVIVGGIVYTAVTLGIDAPLRRYVLGLVRRGDRSLNLQPF